MNNYHVLVLTELDSDDSKPALYPSHEGQHFPEVVAKCLEEYAEQYPVKSQIAENITIRVIMPYKDDTFNSLIETFTDGQNTSD